MRKTIHQPSDKLFKLSMGEIHIAQEFFETHLPPMLLTRMDLNSLQLEKHSFIDEAYKATEADVVYSVKMGEEAAYLYLLCEHQTGVDLQLAFRLLVYTVRIMEMHLKQHKDMPLPLVYPLVIYTGEEPWNAPLDIFPLFGENETLAKEILLKPYQLLNLQQMSDDVLRQQELSGLVAFALKYRKKRDFNDFLEQLISWIQRVEVLGSYGTFLSKIVLQYVVVDIAAGEKDLFIQKSQAYLSPTLRGEIMTIAEQWKEEGVQLGMTIAQQWKEEGVQLGMTIAQQWKEEGVQLGMMIAQQWKEEGVQLGMMIAQQWKEEGVQQGVQLGVQLGEATLVTKLLKLRFGVIPASYIDLIEQADAETLLVWGGKILDAKTLKEVFAE